MKKSRKNISKKLTKKMRGGSGLVELQTNEFLLKPDLYVPDLKSKQKT